MRFKAVTLGMVLAGTALGSAALTLGRARGAAWIGQSLELVVPVQVDAGQADGALCAEADVFHGDSRQDGNRVQVQVEPTGQPDSFNVKILSSALIDEPVVTVYLRAGCSQKSSRKFVLLADFPSETVAMQNRLVAQPPAPLVLEPEARPALVAVAKPAATEPAKVEPKVVAPRVPATLKKSAGKAAKPEVAVAQPKPDAPGKPRLRLDPIDTLSERIKLLESSAPAAPVQDDLARDNQKMQQLQADLRSLLDQAVKNEASLAALRERLEKAESERVPLTLVYGLIALLVACFGSLVYVVTKRPKFASANPASTPDASSTAVAARALAGEKATAEAEAIDVDLLDLDAGSFGEMMDAPGEGHAAIMPRHHNFNDDTLVDLRQQAEFLGKLGKVDEALEVLEAGIRSNPVESPLLFLDLLVIANNASRKTDFRQFSAEFAQLFNVSVPEFALFRDEGRSLDNYPALLEHITNQWESPHVLDVIESCIVRDAPASESDPFDLAAFRELVRMHGEASELHRART